MNPDIEPYLTEDITLNKKSRLPLVWFLPVIALIVSSWLIYKAISEQGPVITITFPDAEGLEVDKTRLKYLDVEVGKVTAITISKDLKSINVTAQMNDGAEAYLKEQTQFWVVRPRVGLGGVSGLNTLLSGPYIGIKPGEGHDRKHFMGLISPPTLKNNDEGKQFVLETTNLGSMTPGTPINYHGVIVGEVLDHQVSAQVDAIKLTIFIKKPYDQLVKKQTRFWIDSGVDLSASADGFKVRTGPLISLLSGGIAFRTSSDALLTPTADEYTHFILYDTYDQSTQVFYSKTLTYVMYFNSSVRGLTEGAPVQLRGIPVGKVTGITLELDKKTAEIRIPVTVEIEPQRISIINNLPSVSDKEMVDALIKKGLRAQLQTGSLLTGQLLVDLDFHPTSKLTLHTNNSAFLEFPTTASSMDQFTHSAQTIMDKIAKLPLEDMSLEINSTLKALQSTSKATDRMLNSAKTTLDTTDKTMTSANQVLNSIEPGSTTRYELDKLLQELGQTASSVKQLTDYLQQHPDTLLHGKSKE